jgi:hypothetical protein
MWRQETIQDRQCRGRGEGFHSAGKATITTAATEQMAPQTERRQISAENKDKERDVISHTGRDGREGVVMIAKFAPDIIIRQDGDVGWF